MSGEKHVSPEELAEAIWQKSSASGGQQDCVEVAFLKSGNIGLRDSRNPTGPALIFTPSEWDAFLGGARDGEFHRP